MTLCFHKTQDEKSDKEPLNALARVVAIWGRVKIGDGK
jgi:hypothetical protein